MTLHFTSSFRPEVREELYALIPKGSFSHLLKRSIGRELHGVLEETEGQTLQEYFVLTLYMLLMGGWRLDTEWLRNEEGIFVSDTGEVIPENVAPSISPVEHLAAYGLWQLSEEYWSLGHIPAEGDELNEQGWGHLDLMEHFSRCVFAGYQALTYCQKIMLGEVPNADQLKKAVQSAMARNAADAKHNSPNGTRAKRKQIQAIWASGKYSSRDICAEQECAALGMSFSTARKALRGTPDPT